MQVTEGWLEAGYEFIMMDDCWLSHERTAEGRLEPDPARFPSGLPALVNYCHKLGLKFGIYEVQYFTLKNEIISRKTCRTMELIHVQDIQGPLDT